MLGVTDYAAFVVTFVVLLMIPGPGNLALVLSTGKGGVRGGLASTLGIILGDQVLLWLALAGVAALLAAYPAAFSAVQWLGAGYLVWLGVRMLLAKPGAAAVLEIRPRDYFRQTLLISISSCIGSIGWFTAMSLESVALVKTLGQVEVLFMLLISAFFFKEKLQRTDHGGLALIVLAAIAVMWA